MERKLVVAGDFTQACEWACEQQIDRNAWYYVHDAESLRGMRGRVITLVGTFRDRRDWPDIALLIRAMQITTLSYP